MCEERGYAVFAHVGCHGDGIDVVFVEECACVHVGSIPDVSAFGVGDDEVVGILFLDVAYGLFVSSYSVNTERLVECEVGLVCHAVGCRCVDDGFVELEQRVVHVEQMDGYALGIGVESHAQEGFLRAYLVDELLSVHGLSVVYI